MAHSLPEVPIVSVLAAILGVFNIVLSFHDIDSFGINGSESYHSSYPCDTLTVKAIELAAVVLLFM